MAGWPTRLFLNILDSRTATYWVVNNISGLLSHFWSSYFAAYCSQVVCKQTGGTNEQVIGKKLSVTLVYTSTGIYVTQVTSINLGLRVFRDLYSSCSKQLLQVCYIFVLLNCSWLGSKYRKVYAICIVHWIWQVGNSTMQCTSTFELALRK